MKCLIIGGNFHNKGAEAMVLVTAERLCKLWPDVELCVASYAKRETRPYGMHRISYGASELSVELIAASRSPWRVVRVLCHRYFTIGRTLVLGNDIYLQRYADANLVVDVSGFALSDSRSLLRRLAFAGDMLTAWALRKPLVLLTQAMGPFDHWWSRALAKWALPTARLIAVRDEKSEAYLRELGIHLQTEVKRFADLAYLLEPTSEAQAAERRKHLKGAASYLVGIVPNVNLLKGGADPASHPYVHQLVRLCRFVRSQLDASVVILCHEGYDDRLIDDEWIAAKVAEHFPETEPLAIVRSSEPATALKAVIGQLDFLIASRFHSLIAAASMGTPFLALGWAHKYDELAKEVGAPDAVLDGRAASVEQVEAAILRLWASRSATRARLLSVRPKLQQSAGAVFETLNDLVRQPT